MGPRGWRRSTFRSRWRTWQPSPSRPGTRLRRIRRNSRRHISRPKFKNMFIKMYWRPPEPAASYQTHVFPYIIYNFENIFVNSNCFSKMMALFKTSVDNRQLSMIILMSMWQIVFSIGFVPFITKYTKRWRQHHTTGLNHF
jgi:hypothetical protein